MARTNNLTNFLTDVADAIRTKTGGSSAISAANFDTEIESIPSGGTPTLQEKSITIQYNGTKTLSYDDGYDGLSQVTINTNVSGGGVDINDYYTSSISNGVQYSYGGWTKTMKKLPGFTFSGNSCVAMFYNCPSQSFDLSNFDTSNTTNMTHMFSQCNEVETINLSNLDTSRVTTMQGMFSSDKKLKSITHNFNLSSTNTMTDMFSGCSALETIDFSNTGGPWTLSNSGNMFGSCSSLRIADLSGIGSNQTDGTRLESASGMFYGCTSLEKIDIRNLKLNNMTSSNRWSNMFYNVPANCEIIVKDATQKSWMSTNFPSLTNVKTVAEYEAEQNA